MNLYIKFVIMACIIPLLYFINSMFYCYSSVYIQYAFLCIFFPNSYVGLLPLTFKSFSFSIIKENLFSVLNLWFIRSNEICRIIDATLCIYLLFDCKDYLFLGRILFRYKSSFKWIFFFLHLSTKTIIYCLLSFTKSKRRKKR